MTKMTAKTVLRHSLYFLIFLLFLLATTNAGNVRRYHRHHQQQQQKKAIQDDYDITDYSSGVFVDRVPIVSDTSSSTSTKKASHNYSKTNRYTNIPSKLRKFREDINNNNNNDSVERKRWLQELFVQKKK
ncbi:unnamed protein product [Meloidogyne enterolobii]|uniref:Uncharacterized protein n=1 Tax=Meloidogyne enterolobii TaxID=390850 RepID=A0ACB1A277_MELEN